MLSSKFKITVLQNKSDVIIISEPLLILQHVLILRCMYVCMYVLTVTLWNAITCYCGAGPEGRDFVVHVRARPRLMYIYQPWPNAAPGATCGPWTRLLVNAWATRPKSLNYAETTEQSNADKRRLDRLSDFCWKKSRALSRRFRVGIRDPALMKIARIKKTAYIRNTR